VESCNWARRIRMSPSRRRKRHWTTYCEEQLLIPGVTRSSRFLSRQEKGEGVAGYVEHYNKVRLNSAIGYITPKDMLAGRQQEIHAERDRKLEVARKQRQIRRQQAVRRRGRVSKRPTIEEVDAAESCRVRKRYATSEDLFVVSPRLSPGPMRQITC